ncbi:MAG: 4Fe-4S binding protein [Bacteroidales bacterium]|nr:4Fe-4S binding protein [Bacteroidales bacterium]
MLRKLRIALAIITFTLVTLLLLGIGFRVNIWAGWVAKIQFLPNLLALNFVMLAVFIVVALLFGRIYCSVVCPLGIMQDIFSWLGGKAKKNRFSYAKEHKWLRYGVLAVFIICLIIGFAPVTTLLAPYSAYGRIVNSLFKPLYDLLNNWLASIDATHSRYNFSEVQVWMRSVTTFVVALLTLLILAVLAWKHGRSYCNSICPVGTILSFFSRFSLFRVRFDKDKCKSCGQCEKNCKARAIDFKAGTVDYSRCVVCGDCLAKCKFDALHYTAKKAVSKDEAVAVEPDQGRRSFLVGTAMATAAAATAQTQMKVDGGLAVIEDKVAPKRETSITPPGSISAKHMQRHCTACQLCVSSCPNNVLRPSTELTKFMQPTLSFERGYCRPECTRCSEVCPTGAIKPITREEKTAIHVGHAVWVKDNCVPLTDGVSCGNCARHCPTGAIQMVEYNHNGQTVMVPAIDENKCIGCGACEHLCPARPFSAIYVEGNVMHHVD